MVGFVLGDTGEERNVYVTIYRSRLYIFDTISIYDLIFIFKS